MKVNNILRLEDIFRLKQSFSIHFVLSTLIKTMFVFQTILNRLN